MKVGSQGDFDELKRITTCRFMSPTTSLSVSKFLTNMTFRIQGCRFSLSLLEIRSLGDLKIPLALS